MVKITAYGDCGLRVCFSETISVATNKKIRQLTNILASENLPEVIEWIPAYTAVTIYYNPVKTRAESLTEKLQHLLVKMTEIDLPKPRIIEIPTCYGGELGPDLKEVAKVNHLTEDEVVKIHSERDYLVYLIGFTAGFPYLGGMDSRIATPRLTLPRQEIPAGSVGIAGEQTGIYPLATPGGWQIIGQTPVKLYDPDQNEPILFQAGDYLRFIPVNLTSFEKIQRAIENHQYEINISRLEEKVK